MIDSSLFSVLATQTWQVAAVAMVVWILARTVAKNRPHLAHALWLVVLLKVLTPPVWSSPTSPFCWLGMTSNPQKFSVPNETFESVSGIRAYADSTFRFDIVDHVSSSEQPIEPAPLDSAVAAIDFNHESGQVATPVHPVRTTSVDWSSLLSWLWIAGALTGTAVLVVRYSLFVLWMRRTQETDFEHVSVLARQLSRRLGIRSRVRVRILECHVGPVVLGLFRPTVVLPAAIVRGKSADELAPLLAHELIHFRRGDLWWALVQAIAKNLFWFHPLVHLAERRVTREAERSCDEETIASLGCSPAAYARCLLGVLEQKHQLRVAPALPGVRPVDITSARLERVMKLGNGIHRKSPAWVWLVLLIGGALALPGAQFILAQEETVTPNAIVSPESNPADSLEQSASFQITIVELSEADTDAFGFDWKFELPEMDEPAKKAPAGQKRASTAIEREIPTQIVILGPEQHQAVIDKAKASGEVCETPTLVTRLALPCELMTGGEIPVAQPRGEVKFRPFGTQARFTPTKIDTKEIHFDCDIQFSRLGGQTLPKTNSGDIDSFPWMSRTKIQASLTAKSGQTVAIRTQYENKKGETTPVVLLIRCRSLGTANLNIQPNPEALPLPSPAQQLVSLQTVFIRPDPTTLKGLGIEWATCEIPAGKVSAKTAHDISDDLQFSGTIQGDRSEAKFIRSSTDNSPTRYAVLDRTQRDQLLEQFRSQANSSITQAPTMSIPDGTRGEYFDGVERPFMVDAQIVSNNRDAQGVPKKVLQPVVKSFKDGVQIGYTPTLTDNGNLRLKSTFAFSKVVASTTIDAPSDKTAIPAKAQRPAIVQRDMSCEMEFPRDQFLVLLISDSEEKPVLVVVDSVADADKLQMKSRVSMAPRVFAFDENVADGQQFQIMDQTVIHPAVKDIVISAGNKTCYRFAFNVPEIAIEDQEIVRVECVSAQDINFFGLKAGKTNCSVKAPDGSKLTFEVVVKDELLPKQSEGIPSQVSLTAKIGMRCSVQLQHEIGRIEVADKAHVEVETQSDFQVLLKPQMAGNTKMLLTQKDGKTIELNLTIADRDEGAMRLPSLKQPDYHWLICCGDDDRSDRENFRTLKTCGLTLLLSKSVVVERKGKLLSLSGDNFFMTTPEGVIHSGNQGRFEITTDIVTLTWTLKGDAKLIIPDSTIMEADEFFQTSNPQNRFELKGNARVSQPDKAVSITVPKFCANADHIWFNEEGARLLGNASLTLKYQDERNESFHGQEIVYSEGEQPKVVEPLADPDQNPIRVFGLSHIKADEAQGIVEAMFDEAKRKSLRLSVKTEENQLVVSGTPKLVGIVEKILTRVDIEIPPNVRIKVVDGEIQVETIDE